MTRRICFLYPGDLEGRSLAHVSGAGRLMNLAELAVLAGFEAFAVGVTRDPAEEGALSIRGLRCFRIFVPENGRFRGFGQEGKTFTQKLLPLVKALEVTDLCLYGTSLKYSRPLVALAKARDLHLLASVNEWGHFSEQKLLTYLLQRAGIRYVRRRFDKVIAISTLMEAFYRKNKRLSVIRIPTIFSREEFAGTGLTYDRPSDLEVDRLRGERIVLVFAGAIDGRKDYVSSMITGLAGLPPEKRERFALWLAGSTREQVAAVMTKLGRPDDLALLGDLVTFYGFLPRQELRKVLLEADFSVLLRPSEPYANAAFPTKFGESFFLGLPVIANLTSDLSFYLQDGENGYVVADETAGAFQKTLERVLADYTYPNVEMKKKAREMAEKSFDLEAYRDAFAEFLTEL